MGATRRTWVDSLLQIPQRRPMAARCSAVVRMAGTHQASFGTRPARRASWGVC